MWPKPEIITQLGVGAVFVIIVLKEIFKFINYQSQKNGKATPQQRPMHCEDHGNQVKRIDDCETDIDDLQQKQVGLTVLVEERTRSIEKELKKGGEKFDTMAGKMENMNTTLSGLAGIISKDPDFPASLGFKKKH